MKLFFLLFADDLSLLSTTQIGLQRLLNNLSQYANKWKLKVNISKSKIIVFRNAGRLKSSEKWFLNGQRIEVVSAYSCLGIL